VLFSVLGALAFAAVLFRG